MSESIHSRFSAAIKRSPLLSAEDERSAAERIVLLRAQLWLELMGYRPTARAVVGMVRDGIIDMVGKNFDAVQLEESLDAVLVAAEKLLCHRRRHLDAFLEAGKSAANILAEADRDCRVASRVVLAFEAAATGEPNSLKLERVPARWKFSDRVDRISRARAELETARDAFANANIRFVLHAVRRWKTALGTQDTISAGFEGLLFAVDHFDHRKGFRFSTYAAWWIRHFIGRSNANQARTVRVPQYVHSLRSKILRARNALAADLGREPTVAEVATSIGIRQSVVRTTMDAFRPTVSMDVERHSDVEVDTGPLPDEAIEQMQASSAVRKCLDQLRPMHREVLRRRFGIGGTDSEGLREIGADYGLSTERIRQLQEEALIEMRKLVTL